MLYKSHISLYSLLTSFILNFLGRNKSLKIMDIFQLSWLDDFFSNKPHRKFHARLEACILAPFYIKEVMQGDKTQTLPKSCTWQRSSRKGAKLNPSNREAKAPTHLSPVKIHSRIISKTKGTQCTKKRSRRNWFIPFEDAAFISGCIICIHTRGAFKDLLPFCERMHPAKKCTGRKKGPKAIGAGASLLFCNAHAAR